MLCTGTIGIRELYRRFCEFMWQAVDGHGSETPHSSIRIHGRFYIAVCGVQSAAKVIQCAPHCTCSTGPLGVSIGLSGGRFPLPGSSQRIHPIIENPQSILDEVGVLLHLIHDRSKRQ